MTNIDDKVIAEVEKELSTSEQEIEAKIQAGVDARLKQMEEEKAAKAAEEQKEASLAAKEKELQDKINEMENKQKELQKQMESISMRKSVPKVEDSEPAPKAYKDLSNEEKIAMNKKYVSEVLGMNI